MRFIKFFSIAAAVLAVASCNKQIEQPVDGDLTEVSVNINLPGNATITKSLEDPTQAVGTTTPVMIETVTATLYYAGGSSTKTITDEFAGKQNATIIFEAVKSPYKVEVSVNGGTADNLTIAEINTPGKGLYAKMYAFTNKLNFSEKNKATAELTLEHRYSRFEISKIYHKDNGDGGCMFASLNFDGIFLNNVAIEEEGIANKFNTLAEANASLKDVADEGTDFLSTSNTQALPANGKCYAYNFFTNQKPEIVLAFDNATGVEGATIGGETRYAVIKKFYKAGTEKLEEIVFEPGNIYRITDVAVADEYTGTTPEGPVNVTLEATVEILPWNIVDTEIGWN